MGTHYVHLQGGYHTLPLSTGVVSLPEVHHRKPMLYKEVLGAMMVRTLTQLKMVRIGAGLE